MVSSDFELNLPTPIYPKQQLGVISNRSRLDAILEKAGINYEQYILYVEAFKVRSSHWSLNFCRYPHLNQKRRSLSSSS